MVKRMQHIGAFLHNAMEISWSGRSLLCRRSSIHLQKIFFLRSIVKTVALGSQCDLRTDRAGRLMQKKVRFACLFAACLRPCVTIEWSAEWCTGVDDLWRTSRACWLYTVVEWLVKQALIDPSADILVYTPEEFERMGDAGLEWIVRQEGVTLYERAPS